MDKATLIADASKMDTEKAGLEDIIRVEFGTRAKVENGRRYVRLDWDRFHLLAYHFYALGQQWRITSMGQESGDEPPLLFRGK